jgi:hypothetical protein
LFVKPKRRGWTNAMVATIDGILGRVGILNQPDELGEAVSQ